MSYLNCPACHLSLQARHGHHEFCPRCLRRDSERVPMFASPLERERQALADANIRLEATESAFESVPTEAPTDALLDFAVALTRAVAGVDTTGSMAQVNAELAALFDGFRIHPPSHGYGPSIEPVLHPDVARAIFEGKFGSTAMAGVFGVAPEPPPMKWLAAAIENRDYSQIPGTATQTTKRADPDGAGSTANGPLRDRPAGDQSAFRPHVAAPLRTKCAPSLYPRYGRPTRGKTTPGPDRGGIRISFPGKSAARLERAPCCL